MKRRRGIRITEQVNKNEFEGKNERNEFWEDMKDM